ncbi:hypothetical protein [Janthinobacterium sp. AD80]|uniref:hypothetical protein n=1 Tax=Janthinobacterium sp. AD80 TaxID=1528773 RepID=UPI000C83E779|nr:hypothetical protein [Janthinobacterium sp. AD80]PMQ16989.1 hypothetical protein JaAD80_08265 [Janthinobacterium sp. AD80]
MSNFKKDQKVNVKGTKTAPLPRPGKFVQTHPGVRGDFVEVVLDGSTQSQRFRPSQVSAA